MTNTDAPNTDALQALLERVEAGTRGSGLNTVSIFGDTQTAMDAVDAFDGSLDAAKALHDAVLPGWHWSLYDDNGIGIYEAQIEVHDWQGEPISGASKCNPARAWLIAILRALIAPPPKPQETP